jgi:hypothetical protein
MDTIDQVFEKGITDPDFVALLIHGADRVVRLDADSEGDASKPVATSHYGSSEAKEAD